MLLAPVLQAQQTGLGPLPQTPGNFSLCWYFSGPVAEELSQDSHGSWLNGSQLGCSHVAPPKGNWLSQSKRGTAQHPGLLLPKKDLEAECVCLVYKQTRIQG